MNLVFFNWMEDIKDTKLTKHSRTHINTQRLWQHAENLHGSKSDRVLLSGHNEYAKHT